MDCPNYLHTDIYHDMLHRLATVRPTINQPCLRSAIIEILGEIGNVWPADVLAEEKEGAPRSISTPDRVGSAPQL